MYAHTWEDTEIHQIWTVKQAIKWFTEGKPEEIPHKSNWDCHEGVTQWLPLSLPESAHVPIYTYCTFFLLINTYFTTFRRCGNSFLQRRGPGPFSLTTGLVARIWCFHHHDPAQSLAGNPSPAPSCCRLGPSAIKTTTMRSTHNTASRKQFTQQLKPSTAKNKSVNKVTSEKILVDILLNV